MIKPENVPQALRDIYGDHILVAHAADLIESQAAELAALKAAPKVPEEFQRAGEWLVDGGLLYTLKDGANFCEINVTMLDGSRALEWKRVGAEYLRSLLNATPLPAVAPISIPADVRQALDRMCQPLDESWLKGATAVADAASMAVIKSFIESLPAVAPTPGNASDVPIDYCKRCHGDGGEEYLVEGGSVWHDCEACDGSGNATPVAAQVNASEVPDEFDGDDVRLVSCIHALLALDASGSLTPHGVGGLARTMLSATAKRLAAPVAAQGDANDAPESNLPTWRECSLRVENSNFIAQRVADGGYGVEHDSLLANDLHRFIYEYDDQDAFKSAWFRHRLELALKAAPVAAQGKASDVPEVGTHWRHTGGGFYVVEGFANMETESPVKYPQTIIYRGVVNGKVWARPLADWPSSFTKMDSPAAPVAPDLAGERITPEFLKQAFEEGYRSYKTPAAAYNTVEDAWDESDTRSTHDACVASRPQVSAPGGTE